MDAARDQPHPFEWLSFIVKRRHTILAVVIAGLLFAAVWTFTETPLYEGRVQLLIDVEDPNVVDFADVVDESQPRQDYYQTQYRLIRSRRVARKTIQTLNLWQAPELTEKPTTARASVGRAIQGVASWLTSQTPLGPRSTDRSVGDETAVQARAINSLLNRLEVTPVRGSRLVELRYRSSNPRQAALVADAVAASYIEQNLEFRFTTTREASSWLEQQLIEQRRTVAQAEADLQRFREGHEAMSFDHGENIVVQKLTELNGAVTRARIDRMQKEAMYQQLVSIQQNPDTLATFPAILSNTFIQEQKATLAQLQREMAQLAERYGDRHPDMVRIRLAIDAVRARIQGQIAEIVQAVRIEHQAALAQEQGLAEALTAQRSAALAMNRKAIDYGVLERDALSSKQIYEALMQRAREIGISGELRTSNIRIVDDAEVPTQPVSPRRDRNLFFGLFGGLLLGTGLAFLFERVDNRIKTPEEIEGLLGLPSLGLIPMVPRKTASTQVIGRGAPSNFVEAFGALRTNVLFSTAATECLSIAVTSTGLGEGKTLVACNLAIGMAQSGRRVLLVDADMRRPQGHKTFGLALEPGLSNLLVGAAGFEEAAQPAPDVDNLWVIPAGRRPPNPAELLGSERFANLLTSLRNRFDLIVFDTSPVMAVTDPAIAAHQVSGVLFVVAADRTSRYAAKRALQQLGHARARFVGAVLNRVDLERNAYYYSKYYRKEYSVYYGVASE